MTTPGLLQIFGDVGMGGIGEEDYLKIKKIDSVLPDKLKKTDMHFKRLEDKSVSESVGKLKTIVGGSTDLIASLIMFINIS